MDLKAALGFSTNSKIRYAVAGLGDIAQEATLPGVKHTGNSKITALVTDDPEKARGVGARYDVNATYGYDGFSELLASGEVDAIYLATPNWRHAEFVIPALDLSIRIAS